MKGRKQARTARRGANMKVFEEVAGSVRVQTGVAFRVVLEIHALGGSPKLPSRKQAGGLHNETAS